MATDHVPPPWPPQEAWPDPVKPPLPEAESPVFTGSGQEYFRIWIVHLCLTLVTLGFYIPWARVRTRRYFYRHTLLGGSSFDYLADPKRLLVGYLIVGVLFLVYMLGDLISIWVTLGALGVFFLAFPYIRYKSLRFFARNSAYQNVRLHFHGTPGEAYRIYLGVLTRAKEAGELSKDLTKGENAQPIDQEGGEEFGLLIGLAAVAFYFVPVMVFLGAGVLIRNHCWNNFRIFSGGHVFRSAGCGSGSGTADRKWIFAEIRTRGG